MALVSQQKKKKKKRRRRGGGQVQRNLGNTIENRWLCALNDPFGCVPLPLSNGTMYPTKVVQVYVRGNFLANSADGSFSIWFAPSQWNSAVAATGSFIGGDNVGVATTPTFAAVSLASTDATQIAADYDGARVLAAGIRVLHTGAMSSASGILSSALYPRDYNGVIANTTGTAINCNTTASLPYADWTRTIDPLQVVWRPVAHNYYEDFYPVASVTHATTGYCPAIAISCIGGPNSGRVFFEAIAHLEVYSSYHGTSAGVDMNMSKSGSGASSAYETVGGMYSSIADFLSPVTSAVLEGTKEAVVSSATTALRAGAAMGVRRLFSGRPTSYRNSNFMEIKYNG